MAPLSPTELVSGIDALYLSAAGSVSASLLTDLATARFSAEASGLPLDADLAGRPVKVLPSAWGRYRWCVVHELGRLGFTPSENLPAARFQPSPLALHALGPDLTVEWFRLLLDDCEIEASVHVAGRGAVEFRDLLDAASRIRARGGDVRSDVRQARRGAALSDMTRPERWSRRVTIGGPRCGAPSTTRTTRCSGSSSSSRAMSQSVSGGHTGGCVRTARRVVVLRDSIMAVVAHSGAR